MVVQILEEFINFFVTTSNNKHKGSPPTHIHALHASKATIVQAKDGDATVIQIHIYRCCFVFSNQKKSGLLSSLFSRLWFYFLSFFTSRNDIHIRRHIVTPSTPSTFTYSFIGFSVKGHLSGHIQVLPMCCIVPRSQLISFKLQLPLCYHLSVQALSRCLIAFPTLNNK